MDEKKQEKKTKYYIAIDLKSFYASVECVERGLDPLNTCLVVADQSRTEKTICLAVTPALKSFGIGGRPRLFEVVERVKAVNQDRKRSCQGQFSASSSNLRELSQNPDFALSYYTVAPRMKHYMEMSSRIYRIYLRYLSKEDIHVYSVDEIFADVSSYLQIYQLSAHELAMKMIRDILRETGITASCGIGTNLYLAKVAMDIVAKHMPADPDGVRIAELDEFRYRRLLWNHRPLSDFWRVGSAYQRKLEKKGLFTMGDIARCSLGHDDEFYNEDLLYRMFGINAELLIDHAWGYESAEISDIKAYRPDSNSLSSGQVLSRPYSFQEAKIILLEMADALCFQLMEKSLKTDQLVLTVGYDIESLTDPSIRKAYKGTVKKDRYGREIPAHAHGSETLSYFTDSNSEITKGFSRLYDRIVNEKLLIRRLYLVARYVHIDHDDIHTSDDSYASIEKDTNTPKYEQFNLFQNYEEKESGEKAQKEKEKREYSLQKAMLDIKTKYGKNAVLRGLNFREGATMKDRNEQVGGHKA